MQQLTARLLNGVVDSLDIRVYKDADISSEFGYFINSMREYIEDWEYGNDDLIIYIADLPFKILPRGSFPYEFVLVNESVCDIRVWNPDKWGSRACEQTGQLYLNFRSLFLQRGGLEAANFIKDDICDFIFGSRNSSDQFERISRLDLAADLELNRELSFSDLDSFVYRARKIEVNDSILSQDIETFMQNAPKYEGNDAAFYESVSNYLKIYLKQVSEDLARQESSDVRRVIMNNKKIQSLYFGRFGSKLYARIYNKPAESIMHGKLYMLKKFHESGWDGKKPVYRVEFSVSGDFLKEFRVDDIKDCRDFKEIENYISSLWKYLTSEWLTHRIVDENDIKNTQRWKFSAFWLAVCGAWDDLGALYRRDCEQTVQVDDQHLYRIIRGCAVSIASRLVARDDIDARTAIYDAIGLMLADNKILDDIYTKSLSHGFDDASLSAAVRSGVMRRGNGS